MHRDRAEPGCIFYSLFKGQKGQTVSQIPYPWAFLVSDLCLTLADREGVVVFVCDHVLLVLPIALGIFPGDGLLQLLGKMISTVSKRREPVAPVALLVDLSAM